MWDILGVEETTANMEAAGMKPAQWVYEMLKKGKKSFYNSQAGERQYYNIPSAEYKTQGGTEGIVFLDTYRDEKTVWKNQGCHLIDVGDGILNLEFHTKMNTIGQEILEGVNKAMEVAEKNFRGLVIANEEIGRAHV